jgi:hypothetical protein
MKLRRDADNTQQRLRGIAADRKPITRRLPERIECGRCITHDGSGTSHEPAS